MYAAACRSALLIGVVGLFAADVGAESPMHQKKPVKLLSTVHATYRMTQQDEEIGTERFERRTYDDNRVVYDVTSTARMVGATMSRKSNLVVDEEGHFPRLFRTDQTIAQPTDTVQIAFTVDLYSNVAVVGSETPGRTDSRRVVVPAGVPVVEIGMAYSWYQILFWADRETRDHQRIQWLDPQRAVVESGEIFVAEERTIDVLGKKTPVVVFNAERERLGAATLYVDAAGRLVRCEQNLTIFELVEWTEK